MSVGALEMFDPTLYLAKGRWDLVDEYVLGISSVVFESYVGLMSD